MAALANGGGARHVLLGVGYELGRRFLLRTLKLSLPAAPWTDVAFWLAAGGGVLLMLGSPFTKI